MRILLFSLCSIITCLVSAQNKITISGNVRDALSGETLIGANVYISELNKGTSTNSYGFYSITIPEGDYTINYSMIGYQTQSLKQSCTRDIAQNIDLEVQSFSVDEVVVSSQRNHNVYSTEMSVSRLNSKEIKKIPVLFGEQDVLKTLQLLPGIKSAGEGSSGFHVRGGGADQNLVLLDEAPVYNPSHLLGFFSIFNSDAIKDTKVYKGGIPAEYGGRLSSVVDVRMNDGDYKKYKVSGGLGLISSRLSFEGPIVKDKGSFIVTGRRTYADIFLGLSNDSTVDGTTLYFYDLNLKANYKLNTKNHVFVSGYFGRDVFKFDDRFGLNWGNYTTTLRWNHLFSDKLFSNLSLIYSNYDYVNTLEGSSSDQHIDISSGIRDMELKFNFQYFLSSETSLKFGLNSVYHTFKPGSLESRDSTVNNRILNERHALENGIYLSVKHKIGSQFTLNAGMRLSTFSIIGPGTFYSYNSDGDRVDSIIVEGSSIKDTYINFEPRISGTYLLTPESSLKLSYTRLSQYVHLLSNTTSGTPNDIWLPTSNNIKPQISNQVAMGYFRNFKNNAIETSLEVYFKDKQNIIDYKNGADLMLNPDVESQILLGSGYSYGAEFLVRKNNGPITGWIGYTLSKTAHQFDEINYGREFPARYDQKHNISVVGIVKLNEKWDLGATWVFNTGNAVTFPSGRYTISWPITDHDHQVPYYTERNGYRMPDYHRLDLSLTYTKKLKKNRESSWNFSIYNAYARKNAYSIYFRENDNNPELMQAVQLSLFRMVPSITYNFKF